MKLHQLHAIHEINIVQGYKGEDTAAEPFRERKDYLGHL